jgi:predicted esterase
MKRALLVVVLAGCPSSSGGTHALFDASGDDFYALPFPNDLRRHADGSLDLSAFPTNSLIVDSYRMVAEDLDGFGMNEAIFARFDGDLDDTTLPDPAGSVADGASVYLVDIDPTSPGYNTRTPVVATYVSDKGTTIGPHHLAVRPFPGFGLDEKTTYALVITNRVLDAAGAPIVRSPGFTDALAGTAYAPLQTWLASDGAADAGAIVSAAVFTTQSATFVIPALKGAVAAAPAPVATNVQSNAQTGFTVFTGAYIAPNFQSGTVPYTNDGGEISVGADGLAVVQRMENMRFALSVPDGATPAAGWPIVIYAHGTGGDYESFIADGTASRLAEQGLAVISTDQVLHGPRNPGGNPEIDFFNIGNPFAARDNALQGAADAFAQLRLAKGLSIVDGARTITVDPTKVMFFGHSQGGLTGPGFVAFEPTLSGAVLSGTGGLIYESILNKTMPVNFPELASTLLRDDPVDENNPSLALAQMWIERADGANYAPLMVRHPIAGNQPRNIFQTEGFTDTFAPNPCIEAFATAIGGDIVMEADTKPVEGITLRGRGVKPAPFATNLDGATAVLAQYDMAGGDDGHFVVFDVPAAQAQSSQFLGTLARTGTATVVTP